MADNVYNYVEPTGVIIPDTETIQEQVIEEYKNLFGQDLIVTPNTPQGLLITAETTARDAVAVNNATLANQINPNFAGGIFLDAILALTGTERTPATFTTVTGTLTGVPGTIVPSGSQVRETTNQALFESVSAVTIPTGGTIDVDFQAVDPGPIAVTPGTLTDIVSNVIGWQTVDNAADQNTLGTLTQTDDQAKSFRKATLAIQGQGLAESILSGVNALPNVTSATFLENVSSSPQVIENVNMNPNSMYLCVDGGVDQAIAEELTNKKNGGCGYTNGAAVPVSVPVTVPFSGQVINVLFDRPDEVPMLVRVTVPADIFSSLVVQIVKDAILNYAAGNIPGEPGLVIGQDVSCFELSAAINYYDRTIFVDDVEISDAAPVAYTRDTKFIEVFEKATIQESSIQVIPA